MVLILILSLILMCDLNLNLNLNLYLSLILNLNLLVLLNPRLFSNLAISETISGNVEDAGWRHVCNDDVYHVYTGRFSNPAQCQKAWYRKTHTCLHTGLHPAVAVLLKKPFLST